MSGSGIWRTVRWPLYGTVALLTLFACSIVAFSRIFPAGWADQFWIDEVVTDPASGQRGDLL